MWFEIIPAFSIVCLAMAAPHYIAPLLNSLIVGNSYRRWLGTKELRLQYLRDRRLTGNPYVVSGLDDVEDRVEEEEDPKKKKKKGPPPPPPPEAVDYCAEKEEA